jgi:N-methylhydantoinase B/oxoprolinase/acetone carboxylase alpha subunit
MPYAQDNAARAAALRARADRVRKLIDDVFDETTQRGMRAFAEECEHRAAALEEGEAAGASPSPASASRSS